MSTKALACAALHTLLFSLPPSDAFTFSGKPSSRPIRSHRHRASPPPPPTTVFQEADAVAEEVPLSVEDYEVDEPKKQQQAAMRAALMDEIPPTGISHSIIETPIGLKITAAQVMEKTADPTSLVEPTQEELDQIIVSDEEYAEMGQKLYAKIFTTEGNARAPWVLEQMRARGWSKDDFLKDFMKRKKFERQIEKLTGYKFLNLPSSGEKTTMEVEQNGPDSVEIEWNTNIETGEFVGWRLYRKDRLDKKIPWRLVYDFESTPELAAKGGGKGARYNVVVKGLKPQQYGFKITSVRANGIQDDVAQVPITLTSESSEGLQYAVIAAFAVLFTLGLSTTLFGDPNMG